MDKGKIDPKLNIEENTFEVGKSLKAKATELKTQSGRAVSYNEIAGEGKEPTKLKDCRECKKAIEEDGGEYINNVEWVIENWVCQDCGEVLD